MRPDGRTLRGERTQAAVVQALLDMLREGDMRPSAREIAERARVSLRSVFQHFEDLESLHAMVADLQIKKIAEMGAGLVTEGQLEERLPAFVEHRTRVLETITPVRRAALHWEPFSEEIARRLTWAHEQARGEVERAFAPEIAARAHRERAELLAALDCAAAWPSWENLRRTQGLDVARARKIMERTLRALLKEGSSWTV